MKFTLLTCVSLMLAFSSVPNPDARVVDDNSQFAFELYQKLPKANNNVFLSPYSISSALAMTYSGARGETEKEMAHTMHFSGHRDSFPLHFRNLMDKIAARNGKDIELSIANRLFGQQGFHFEDKYLKLTNDIYHAPLEQVDFKRKKEESREHINTWVEKQTKDKIKDLVPPGSITEYTRLVLVNAIYFYGDWMYQFDTLSTRKGDFYKYGREKTEVSLMFQKAHLTYMETADFQAIRLPYKGYLSMEIFLPRERDGLEKMEKSMSWKNYKEWTSSFVSQEVVLTLPKFRMTSDFMLKDLLEKMGMRSAFSDPADFSGMTGRKELFISEVIHKAFIDVSEKGTEAAAATAVVMDTFTSMKPSGPPAKIFRADHPFFFIIRDNSTGSILFMGRVTDPRVK